MDELMGVIKTFAASSNWVPTGYALCNGATMSISHNQALFAIIGTAYGGDGRSNFQLPDLRPKNEDGSRRDWEPGEPTQIICVQGIFPPRN